MKYPKDISGIKIGRLTVVENCDYISKNGKICKGVKCRCDCGNIKIVRRSDFLSGKSKSCGCLIREFNLKRECKNNLKNVASLSSEFNVPKVNIEKLFNIYKSMKNRCYKKDDVSYKNYGERGIDICDEWLESRDCFVKWAIENNFEPGLSIDRIDNNKGYSPDNCKFSDRHEQAINKRNTILVLFNGKYMPICDMSKETGMSYEKIRCKVRSNKIFSIRKSELNNK